MKKYLILLIIFNIIFYSCFSQTYKDKHFVLNENLSGSNKTYIARDYIKLKDGFEYTAQTGERFVGKIDPSLIFETNYNEPPTAWSSDLPVGSLPGSVNVSPSGAATYQIPIVLPPGTSGMMPNLSIVYNSQSGDGMLGRGWTIGGFSAITRIPATLYHDDMVDGVDFDGNDRFALDGQRLIMTEGEIYGEPDAVYHTEIESFSQITSLGTSGGGPSMFKVETKSGMTLQYAYTNDSRIEATNKNDIMYWLLNEVTDANGNSYEINYEENDGEFYPTEINYTKNGSSLTPYNKVKFLYTKKTDKTVAYAEGSKFKSTVILSDIKIYNNGGLIRKYTFKYNFNSFSRLSEIQFYEDRNKTINTTKIEWDPSSNNIYDDITFEEINSEALMPGDYSGNGIADIACLKYKRDADLNIVMSNGRPVCTQFNLYISNDNSGNSYENVWSIPIDDHPVELIPGNFNGDDKQDLLVLHYNSDGSKTLVFFISRGDWFYQKVFTEHLFFEHNENFKVADFNGDGKDDWLIIRKEITDDCIVYDDKGNKSYEDYLIGNTLMTIYSFTENTSAPLQIAEYEHGFLSNINIADINGNGKTDILLREDELCNEAFHNYIFEIDENNEIAEIYNNETMPGANYKGDYNGDGKIDFLTYSNSNGWKIYHSTGTGFIEADAPNLNTSNYDKNMYYVADFDGNGLADVIEYEFYKEVETYWPYSEITQWDYYYHINLHYNYGYTFEKQFIVNTIRTTYDYYAPHFPKPIYHQVQPSIDINGDGKQDFVGSKFANGQSSVTTGATVFYPHEKKHLVKSITNGYNNKTEFEYKPITYTNDEFYTKGNGANFPVIDFQGALYAVKNLTVPNGIGSQTTTQNYKYQGAKIHKQGKGFLGFTKVISENETTNIFSETEFTYHEDYFNTYPVSTKTYYNSTSALISSSTVTNQYIQHLGNKRIFTYPKETESTDHLTNTTVSSNVTYDSNGNLTRSYINYDNEGNTETLYQDYITAGAWLPTKPETTIVKKTAIGKPLYTRTSEFEYYGNGLLKKSIADPSENKSITSEYWYNSFGNATHTKVSAPDEDDRDSYFSYDNKNRFVINQTDPLGFTSEQTYDEETGNILAQTDINGHTTKFKYDAFGGLIETELPDGTKAYQTTEWCGNNGKTYVITSADGEAPVTTYYDILGRKTKTESSSFNNETIISKTEYNSKGQVYKTYEPYFEGETGNYTTFSYDDYGRQSSIISPIGTTSYSHSYGSKTTTVTMPDGEQTSKTINSLGQVIEAEDNGGTINYDYNSAGLPVTITTPGGAEVVIEYDNYGNKTSLTDPDAGTITYIYDAFSNIESQTDANENMHEKEYDIAGRLIEKSGTEGVTTYIYDTSPNGLGMLASEAFEPVDNSPNSKTYIYDNLSRLSSVTETYEDEDYTYSYNYDNLGRIYQMTYPNGFSYTKHYKLNGYLEKIMYNQETDLIWKAEEMNALGQLTEYVKGNNQIRTYKTYDDYHRPEEVITGDFQHFIYDFEKESGNLLSREDDVQGNFESFEYDNNRLHKVWQGYTPALVNTINYHNPTGNITGKTDAGNYSYNDSKHLHAVTHVTGDAYLPSQNQSITYTAFNKVEEIREGFNKGIPGKKLTFTYGLNNQRKKTTANYNGNLAQTKYFFGSYEKTINNYTGEVTEYNFLPGGAIFKKTGNEEEMLFTYTDHLGSITHITDDTGNLLAEQSFDAWGRIRNADDWTYEDAVLSGIINGRGYTGHEMLLQFGIINMNGRLYDPVLGRMLSPDNFIQAPNFTQSFNRYSYVINNPLKYTDPSGQWIGWDDAIVAGAGFVFGYVSYGITNKDWGWNAVGAGAIGAVVAWLGYNTAGLAGGISSNTWGFIATTAINTGMNMMMEPMQVSINDNWSVSVSPSFFYSTEGFGAGLIGGVHYTNNNGFSASVYGSAQFGQGYVSKRQGIEFRAGGQISLTNDKGNTHSFGINYFGSGETSQFDWVYGYSSDKFSFRFEEDYKFSDKFRTGAAQFGYKYNEDIEYAFGFIAYTGEPNEVYRFYHKNGKTERYYVNPNAYKYLSGVLYAGVNYKGQTFQAGMNSEKIRGFIQNGIHSGMNRIFNHNGTPKQTAHFIERPNINPNSLYLNYGIFSPYSLYP